MTKKRYSESETLNGLKATVHVDPTRSFTTVFLLGSRYTGVGTSKLHPDDTYDVQIGIDVAMVRALRDLADQNERGVKEKTRPKKKPACVDIKVKGDFTEDAAKKIESDLARRLRLAFLGRR